MRKLEGLSQGNMWGRNRMTDVDYRTQLSLDHICTAMRKFIKTSGLKGGDRCI